MKSRKPKHCCVTGSLLLLLLMPSTVRSQSYYEAIHQSLSTFYTVTGGENWTRSDNWNLVTVPTKEELLTWYGIGLKDGKLVRLHLPENNLTGVIPAEIGDLQELEELFLASNSLTGVIPEAINTLKKIEVLDLSYNKFHGSISLGIKNFHQLRDLNLTGNTLNGEIPSEIANLSALTRLCLDYNELTGAIPEEIGNMRPLQYLGVSYNMLTGQLPRSLMQLDSLRGLYFEGQDLCAPRDENFQSWLSRIPHVSGLICGELKFREDVLIERIFAGDEIAEYRIELPEASGSVGPYTYKLTPDLPVGLTFHESSRIISGVPMESMPLTTYTYEVTDGRGSSAGLMFLVEFAQAVHFRSTIGDQSLARGQPMIPVMFPEASGGVKPVTYSLTLPLPVGLIFDASTRVLSGTPMVITDHSQRYKYHAIGAKGSSDSLMFTIDVFSPVTIERALLPESFVVHGNYPNPFQGATQLIFDLPWPARVTVEVMDLTGRRVLAPPTQMLSSGQRQSLLLNSQGLASGLYIYRLIAESSDNGSMNIGSFVHLR